MRKGVGVKGYGQLLTLNSQKALYEDNKNVTKMHIRTFWGTRRNMNLTVHFLFFSVGFIPIAAEHPGCMLLFQGSSKRPQATEELIVLNSGFFDSIHKSEYTQ